MTAPRERAGPKRWKLVLWRRGTGVASSPSVSNNCGEVIIASDFQFHNQHNYTHNSQ